MVIMNCYTSISTFFVCFIFQLLLVAHIVTCSSDIPFQLLAKVVQEKLSENSNTGNAMTIEEHEQLPSISKLTRSLSALASNQQAFKVSYVRADYLGFSSFLKDNFFWEM